MCWQGCALHPPNQRQRQKPAPRGVAGWGGGGGGAGTPPRGGGGGGGAAAPPPPPPPPPPPTKPPPPPGGGGGVGGGGGGGGAPQPPPGGGGRRPPPPPPPPPRPHPASDRFRDLPERRLCCCWWVSTLADTLGPCHGCRPVDPRHAWMLFSRRDTRHLTGVGFLAYGCRVQWPEFWRCRCEGVGSLSNGKGPTSFKKGSPESVFDTSATTGS
ncbi:hypothetical protein ABH900_000471 [Stenotrophomonas sp. AN71]